jgi:hypothetical protein
MDAAVWRCSRDAVAYGEFASSYRMCFVEQASNSRRYRLCAGELLLATLSDEQQNIGTMRCMSLLCH